MAGSIWKQDKIDQLRELSQLGLSASEIGKKIGVSRDAVIAKMAREKIPSRYNEKRIKVPKIVKKTQRRIKKPESTNKESLNHPSFRTVTESSKNLFDLSANDCRWPVGRTEIAMFCGKPKHEISSYCEEHYCVAYGLEFLEGNVP